MIDQSGSRKVKRMNRVIPGGPLNPCPEFSSIPEMIQRTAEMVPDRIAVREPAELGKFRSISYRQLAANIDWVARGILELEKEPVAAVVGANSISWYTVYLAVHRAGGIVVPMDPDLPEADMHTILHYSGANMIFHDSDYSDRFQNMKDIISVTMNAGLMEDGRGLSSVLRQGRMSSLSLPSDYDTHKPALISYTSGTTGLAKGVVHSQDTIIADIRQTIKFVFLDETDVFLSILPVHHMYEGTAGFLLPLSMGAEIAISHGLRYIKDDLAATKATVVFAVPLLWEAVYRRIMESIKTASMGKAKLGFGMAVSAMSEKLGIKGVRRKVFSKVHDTFGGHLRLLISGGSGIDPEVIEGFEKLGFRILQGYGLTETAPIIAVNRVDANRYGSVGPVFSEMECRISEPDSYGVGEIQVKGPNVMLGYFGDPEATAEVLSSDGWFRTGDFGYLDRDGFLFITGRKKNVIIAKNGKNVYPEEIETRLNRFSHVKECIIFGKLSETKGEDICALVFPDRDLLIAEAEKENRKLSIKDEIKAVRNVVRDYNRTAETHKRITGFIISEEEFPKTTTKKIKRKAALKEAGITPGEIFRV
ncbi:hypothetical protein CSA37_01585 [Candidatus Fermentibacteria bacterium]|nr:MAG: hypothetical protein CSA37_13545 [Candidatus Fermentibacteria bacterium]PIE53375.1 MAG: hypothetical protein CSA37_01585 [Candidatus Fermentibacteria bacterium]